MGERTPSLDQVQAMLPVAQQVIDRWAKAHPLAAASLPGRPLDTLGVYIAEALVEVEAGTLGLQGAIERALQRTTDRGRAR